MWILHLIGWLALSLACGIAQMSAAQDLAAADKNVSELRKRLTSDLFRDPSGQSREDEDTWLAEAVAACDVTEKRSDNNDKLVARIAWTGGCTNGKRHGPGQLTISYFVIKDGSLQNSHMQSQSAGTMVAGRRVGLWCFEADKKMTWTGIYRHAGSCDLLFGDTTLADLRKTASGNWKLPGPRGLHLPAEYIEAQSTAAIAAASAGQKQVSLSPLLTESSAVDDLLPGGRFTFRPSRVDRAGKRVALVLTSATTEEIERFNRDREAFAAAMASERPAPEARSASKNKKSAREEKSARGALFSSPGADELIAERQTRIKAFMDLSDPKRIFPAVVNSLSRAGFTVGVETDLNALAAGRYDYALVFEWRSLTNFAQGPQIDQFETYQQGEPFEHTDPESLVAERSLMAGQAMGWLLFNQKLEVVQQCPLMAPRHQLVRQSSLRWDCTESLYQCNTTYLRSLAFYYGEQWYPDPPRDYFTDSWMDMTLARCL